MAQKLYFYGHSFELFWIMFFPVQSEMGTAPMASGAKSYCLKVGVKVNLIFPLLSTTDEKKDKGKEIKHVSWTVDR